MGSHPTTEAWQSQVECAGLENRYAGDPRIAGSNPAASAAPLRCLQRRAGSTPAAQYIPHTRRGAGAVERARLEIVCR